MGEVLATELTLGAATGDTITVDGHPVAVTLTVT
jgi:hypothetical protein